MVRIIGVFFIALVLWGGLTPLKANVVETNTHTYIISKDDNCMLAIDRKTGNEKIIQLGLQPKSMVIYGDRGYIEYYHCYQITVIDLKETKVIHKIPLKFAPRSITMHRDKGYVVNEDMEKVLVIDLIKNTYTHSIDVGKTPQPMVVYGDKGYVSNQNARTISVIDLITDTLSNTIQVYDFPESMVIYKDLGYISNKSQACVSVIDLKTDKVTQSIPVWDQPEPMIVHGDIGYVVNKGSNTVSVINLAKNIVSETIHVAAEPESMAIYDGYGYIVCSCSTNLYVIDLKTNTVRTTIPIPTFSQPIKIYRGVGYVQNIPEMTVTIIDLASNKVVSIFVNPDNKSVAVSDTHMYLGDRKVQTLYPTIETIKNLIQLNKVRTYFNFMHTKIDVTRLDPLQAPTYPTYYDELPIEEVVENLKPWENDGYAYLVFLTMLKYPEHVMCSKAWHDRIRYIIYTTLFQVLWEDDPFKTQDILRYILYLAKLPHTKDPILNTELFF